MRSAFVKALCELASVDKQVYLITGDLGYGALDSFIENYFDQYINAGISEQAMTSIAAGLSMCGNTVFTYSIANFSSLRCLEQIRNDILYHNANVKIVSIGSGLAYGGAGMTHHGTEDMAIMRALPGITIFCPCDEIETIAVVKQAYKMKTPCYLRIGKGGEPRICQQEAISDVFMANHLRVGKGVCIFSTGAITIEAIKASEIFKKNNIFISVFSFPTIKPLDSETIIRCAFEYDLIVTLEEHNKTGGFGSAVSEIFAELSGNKSKLVRIGINDTYTSVVGTQEYLRNYNKLTAPSIVEKIYNFYSEVESSQENGRRSIAMESDSNDLKNEILELVKEYYEKNHCSKKEFQPGDRIAYAGRVYGATELVNLVDSALEFWLTSGRYSEQFEKKFADYLNVKFCALVNSGSSANLLAFMALTSPLLDERQIKKGDEVITVAAGFPTTVTPIIQYGAIPVFLDITIPQYNIDVTKLEEAYSEKTKAVMIAHTLGNPFDINTIKSFCDKHNLWLVEDNCDALGSKYIYNKEEKYTGTVGDIGTSSFYPPHHMTMGEGGAVYTNNPLLHKIVVSLRDWGRDCICKSGQDNLCKNRFSKQYGELPLGYDHKYVYSHFGYNLKATDMQAAIGCAQLEKLDLFIKSRHDNFFKLYEGLKDLDDYFILPEPFEGSTPSWFGFLLTCKKDVERGQVIEELEKRGIQTRMLFAGNLIKHPCFDQMRLNETGYRVVGDLDNTNRIMQDTFWVGVYPGMDEKMIRYIIESTKFAIESRQV